MSNESAILDGEEVPTAQITKMHRFIGYWRPPRDPLIDITGCDRIVCRCGATLWYRDTDSSHWKRGCFDLPQYVTVKETQHHERPA